MHWCQHLGLNRRFHLNPDELSASVSLSEVTAVNWRKGLFTSIIDIETEDERLTLRCYKSKSFARAIEDAVSAVKNASIGA